MNADASGRRRVDDGEEARLTPGGPDAAEIVSRGWLPLRLRTEAAYRLRPAFPGTAVDFGERTYEVVGEREHGDRVIYRLREWPEGEVIRDRVIYGTALVRAAQAERERARVRRRARPWRFLLYPFVGLLPEPEQERLGERLGIYAVTATLVSGLAEALGLVLFFWWIAGGEGLFRGGALALASPALGLTVVAGLGRAFGAAALRETTGQWLVVLVWDTLRALRPRIRHDPTFVPLTRAAFWARLDRPDRIEAQSDGTVLVMSLLPHVLWLQDRRVLVSGVPWSVLVEPPLLDRGRLLHRYRLVPPPGAEAPSDPPAPIHYAEQVRMAIAREWDDVLGAFPWLVSLLGEDVQARAVGDRGGPAVLRRAALSTAALSIALALWLLHFLPGPPGDPLAPAVALGGVGLIADGTRRIVRAQRREYAPSLLRALLPSATLRPERFAYHAHRDAEREALALVAGAGREAGRR